MNNTRLAILGAVLTQFWTDGLRAARVDFVREVRPVFEKHCTECHGEKKQKSGLRLDVKAAALRGGDEHGSSFIAGDAKASPLIRLVTSTDAEKQMPPKGERLTAAEIDTLTRWINEGAVWPDGVDRVRLADRREHWSFKPLSAPDGPRTIDSFIDAKLAENGLSRSQSADPVALIRRIAFDLTGLPPTPEQVSAFVEQCREGSSFVIRQSSLQRLMDDFLASPRYGERWAQHWLDVVRYADTHGFEVNTERPNAWPYRDYVIRAFNNDTPYDQFIKEQIVGDAMGEDAATGFLVTASVLLPGQIGKDEPSIRLARQDSLDEIVNNVGQTFLGLSVGCARCHDHKFDPITAKDYYAMQAFFAGVQYEERPIRDPKSDGPRVEQAADIEAAIAALRKRLESAQPGRVIFIDDEDSERTTSLKKKNGHGENPAGAGRGYRDDAGDADRAPNLSRGRYTWWDNVAGDDTFTWNPGIEGRFRIWLSWGVHGSGVHTRDARYVLDRDGNLATRDDQTEIGNADQFRFANVTDGDSEMVPLWSGLHDAGMQELRRESRIILRGGKTGTGITADVIVLEEADGLKLAVEELSRLENRKKEIAQRPVVFGGAFTKPDEIRLLSRGDPEQPKEEVLPAVLSAFGELTLPKATPEQERRKALADWIASPKNPLTARVMVNRIWQGHFGVGLVETPSDFGNNGTTPSHPELLDWLAAEFMRSGWSVKHMHRLIVMSGTYRQRGQIYDLGRAGPEIGNHKSRIMNPGHQIDADARLLWRLPGRRLEAETIRDSMLAVSGRLNLTMYGRGFDLFTQRGGLSGFNPVETLMPENQRRMIYAHKVRREPEAVFGAFDCPDAGQSTAIRRASTTPIQALNLFNSQFTLQLSEAFTARVKKETGDDLGKQINRVYQLALTRDASADEIADAEPLVRQHGLAVLCRAIFNSNEFLFAP